MNYDAVDTMHVVINDISIDSEAFAVISEFAGSEDNGKRFLAALLAGFFVIMDFVDQDSAEWGKIRLYIEYGKDAAFRVRGGQTVEPAAIALLCEYTGQLISRCGKPDNMQTKVTKILEAA